MLIFYAQQLGFVSDGFEIVWRNIFAEKLFKLQFSFLKMNKKKYHFPNGKFYGIFRVFGYNFAWNPHFIIILFLWWNRWNFCGIFYIFICIHFVWNMIGYDGIGSEIVEWIFFFLLSCWIKHLWELVICITDWFRLGMKLQFLKYWGKMLKVNFNIFFLKPFQ